MNQQIVDLLDGVSKCDILDSDYVYNGVIVPRVTHIIQKCICDEGLFRYANTLGFKHIDYKENLLVYAAIGSECHSNIDLFMDDKNHIANFSSLSSETCYKGFLKWWQDINRNNKINVLLHEEPLVCKYFGGTLDALYEINGKKYLLDYKTSSSITFKYFLQLSAYRYILSTEKGIDVDGFIILQLSRKQIKYKEYLLDFSNKNDLNFINACEECFMSLVYSYYNLLYVEKSYKSINWRGK